MLTSQKYAGLATSALNSDKFAFNFSEVGSELFELNILISSGVICCCQKNDKAFVVYFFGRGHNDNFSKMKES